MRQVLTLILASLALVGCAGDEPSEATSGARIVVTTNILGDIVREVVGEQATVDVLMPLGADPHDFALSARQADSVGDADLIITNGGGIEAGIQAVIDASKSDVFVFADHVALRSQDGQIDPHIWTDPLTMEPAVRVLGEALSRLPEVDATKIAAQTEAYAGQLAAADAAIREKLAGIPEARRVLVTNHEVFGYFADRYGFTVLGAVVPSLTTGAQASAKDIEALAATVKEHHVPAIFAETTQSAKLADALAREVGESVTVVELYAESLGKADTPASTYLGMLQTNADLIAAALGG